MTEASSILEEEASHRTPAPPELLAEAQRATRKYPECFVWWHPDAKVQCLEDVRVVIECLREYGGHAAWRDAQHLRKCL